MKTSNILKTFVAFVILLFVAGSVMSCGNTPTKNKKANTENRVENGNEEYDETNTKVESSSILNITKPTTFKTTKFQYRAYDNPQKPIKKDVSEWFFTFYTDGTCEFYQGIKTQTNSIDNTTKVIYEASPEVTSQGEWGLCERSIKNKPFRAIIIVTSSGNYLCFTEGGFYLEISEREILDSNIEDLKDLLMMLYNKEQISKENQRLCNLKKFEDKIDFYGGLEFKYTYATFTVVK